MVARVCVTPRRKRLRPRRPGPRGRLVIAMLTLGLVGLVASQAGLVDQRGLRDTIDRAGPLAPLVFVLAAGVLAALLVPGPLLAGTSGLLFGTVLGSVLTVAAATLTAVLTVLGGRRSARAGVRAGRRSEAVAERVRERGVLAVVVQRLLPGVNDAAGGYAFGALGVSVRQVVLGTLLATPPRAFAYTALGDSLEDPTSPLALVAFGVLGGMGVLGAVVGWRVARRRPAAAPAGQAT